MPIACAQIMFLGSKVKAKMMLITDCELWVFRVIRTIYGGNKVFKENIQLLAIWVIEHISHQALAVQRKSEHVQRGLSSGISLREFEHIDHARETQHGGSSNMLCETHNYGLTIGPTPGSHVAKPNSTSQFRPLWSFLLFLFLITSWPPLPSLNWLTLLFISLYSLANLQRKKGNNEGDHPHIWFHAHFLSFTFSFFFFFSHSFLKTAIPGILIFMICL